MHSISSHFSLYLQRMFKLVATLAVCDDAYDDDDVPRVWSGGVHLDSDTRSSRRPLRRLSLHSSPAGFLRRRERL